MKFLLDTNICIYVINDRPKGVVERFRKHRLGDIGVSSITVAELAYGVAKTKSERNRNALERFLLPLEIADFDHATALVYGNVRADLERRGRLIGPLDMLIAAHGLALNAILVTNNEREFGRIPGLAIENWTE
jgi:tRNA(fMet)-specific endonuclease VapC